jgi:hypothetical protein
MVHNWKIAFLDFQNVGTFSNEKIAFEAWAFKSPVTQSLFKKLNSIWTNGLITTG